MNEVVEVATQANINSRIESLPDVRDNNFYIVRGNFEIFLINLKTNLRNIILLWEIKVVS